MRMKIDVIPTGATTATVILTQRQVDHIRGAEGRSRVPIAITYRGTTYRTSVSVYRGEWMAVVNKEMREGGLAPGASYTVDISLDTQERTVAVPSDFAKALKAAGLRPAFDALAYSHRKEHVRAIEDAKKPETRQRRIEAALAKVSSGARR